MTRVSSTSIAGDSNGSGNTDMTWLASGSAISIVGGLLGRVFQIVSQVLLARLLGPSRFGAYTIGWTMLRIGGIFTPLGLDNGVIHYASRLFSQPVRLRSVVRTSLWLALGIGTLAGTATALAAPLLSSRVFGKQEVAVVIYGFAIGFPLVAGLRVASAGTRASQRMQYSVYSETIAQPAANLILIVPLFYAGLRLMGAVTAAVASYGFALALAVFYQRQLFGKSEVKTPNEPPLLWDLLSFSVPASIAVVLANLEVWIDRLVVGVFLSSDRVGIYQAAAQTALAVGVIGGSFNLVFSSRISLLYCESESKRLDQLFKTASRWTLYAVMPLFLAAYASPRNFLSALYGSQYAEGAVPLALLCVAEMIGCATGPVGSLLVFTEHQFTLALASACGLSGAVVLSVILIPRFGLIGAASATALGSAAIEIAKVLAVRRKIGIWPFDLGWLKIPAAAAATLIVLIVSHVAGLRPQWLGLLATLALSGVVFLSCLVLLGLESEEIEVLALARLRLRALTRGLALDVK